MSTTEQTILDIIAKEGAIDRATIQPGSTMQALGVHSLDAVQIIFEIEDRFDISVPEAEAQYATGTVQQLVDGVERLIAAKGGPKE